MSDLYREQILDLYENPLNHGELDPHDIAQILDEQGIAIRAGHHCAMPLHHHLGLNATARASFYVHTTTAEIDALVRGLHHVRQILRL